MAKLTNLNVIEIKQLLITKKYTHSQIGKMFNVSKTVIGNIKRLKSWIDIGSEYNNELQIIKYKE